MKLYFRTSIAGLLSFVVSAVPVFAGMEGEMLRDDHDAIRSVSSEARDSASRGAVRSTEIRQDEIIVKFKGAERFSRVAVLSRESVAEALARLWGRDDVLYAEPNYIATAYMTPNDPYYSYQWHLQNSAYGGIHTENAWDSSTGSGVIVAVVDTGVAYEDYGTYRRAPDLAGTAFVAGYDFVNNDTHPNDDNSHGTHVAGTVAQSTNNGQGVAGVAFGAALMPVKVLNAQGSGSYADVADGIRWAADHGAHVITLSLGGPSPATYLEEAVRYAHEKGVTVVAASGNENDAVGFPAAYDNYVIAVGATRYDEQRAPYSNYGASLDVVAPGGDLQVDQNGDGYGDGVLQQTFGSNVQSFGYYFFQGTSMATPHVAGVAALVISRGNATTTDAVRAALETTADDLGAVGRDDYYGHGLLNASAAVAYTGGPENPPPDDPPAATSTPITVFSDSFEVSEWNGLWMEDSQNDWFRSLQRASSGSRSAEVDGLANDASLTSVLIDTQGKTTATVSFSWFIESALDSGEYLALDVSVNGGTWVEQKRLRGNVDQENVWHSVSIPVNNANSLRLRFRGKMSSSNEDANVDNVIVTAQ